MVDFFPTYVLWIVAIFWNASWQDGGPSFVVCMINNLKFQVRFHAVTSDCTHLLLMFEMDVISASQLIPVLSC